jgi:flavin-dependent thymidylate synthase
LVCSEALLILTNEMDNNVNIIGWYGGDKAIARAAWTSTQIDIDLKSESEIENLIVNKLWNNESGKHHKTPFERGIVEFNIICEQASHIHLLKHRLANINGESARYKELKEDKFYIPKDWKDVEVNEKHHNMNYINNQVNANWGKYNWEQALSDYTMLGNKLYHYCLEDLTPVLGRKRAKESARYFKTMNSQITLSVMMNMSCFYNFYTLRHDKAAQKEIQYITEEMLNCIKNIEGNPFEYTLKAFNL